jgi:hypothetical protein
MKIGAEESRKRRRLILLSTESPSPDMNPQQTTISVNADIIPDSTISDLELAVARNKSIFGAMRDGIFGHIVSSTVAASSE